MGKKKFKTDLSTDGIEKLIQDLLNYKNNELQQKVDLLARTLAEKGVKIAKANITKLDAIFTGELLSSVHLEQGNSGGGKAVFFVVADSEHAAFVEFGTGQLGKEAPYPFPLPPGVDWQYNTGKTIRQAKEDIYVGGSVYVSVGEYFWSYIGKDGKLHITKGMPSRPFLHETTIELMQTVEKTAKEIFK